METSKIANIIKWHRRLVLVCVVFLLASTISGMSRTVDKMIDSPVLEYAPSAAIDVQQLELNAAQVLTLIPDQRTVQHLECRSIDGQAWWQCVMALEEPVPHINGQFGPPLMIDPVPVYINASTGEAAGKELDERYALSIAAQCLGQTAHITEQVTGFTFEYGFIDRIHPVYRCVANEDASQVLFVSTIHGIGSKYLNTRKKIDKVMFSFLHKYFFIKNRELREGLLCLVCGVMCAAALSGLWLWWRLRTLERPRPSLLRRWHGRIGLVACILTICGSSSGIVHTVMVYVAERPAPPMPDRSLPALGQEHCSLKTFAGDQHPSSIGLRKMGAELVYQFRFANLQENQYVNASTGALIENGDLQYAQSVAEGVLGTQVEVLEYKTAFDLDYPVINKFLPVYACAVDAGAEGRMVYVCPSTGSITRSTYPVDRFQQNLFQYMHSWAFVAEPWRSMIILCFGFTIIGASIIGMILFWKGRRE